MTGIRTGQALAPLARRQFQKRCNVRDHDRARDTERDAIARLEVMARVAPQDGRKGPVTRLAGPDFADRAHKLSVQWMDTRSWPATLSRAQACRPMCWT